MEWGWGAASSWSQNAWNQSGPGQWRESVGWGDQQAPDATDHGAWKSWKTVGWQAGAGPEKNGWDQDGASVDKDKHKNVSTFGCCGRKPLPLDDRKDVLLSLVGKLMPGQTLSKMAVAAWNAQVTMAAFFILTQTAPKTPLRWLKDDEGSFTVTHAVKVLIDATKSIFPTEEAMHGVVEFIIQHSWSNSEAILERAVGAGFDPSECLELPKGQQALAQMMMAQTGAAAPIAMPGTRFDSRSGMPGSSMSSSPITGGGVGANPGGGRQLGRCISDTQHEIERLQRRKQFMAVQKEVREEEMEMALAQNQGSNSDSRARRPECPPGVEIHAGKPVQLRGVSSFPGNLPQGFYKPSPGLVGAGDPLPLTGGDLEAGAKIRMDKEELAIAESSEPQRELVKVAATCSPEQPSEEEAKRERAEMQKREEMGRLEAAAAEEAMRQRAADEEAKQERIAIEAREQAAMEEAKQERIAIEAQEQAAMEKAKQEQATMEKQAAMEDAERRRQAQAEKDAEEAEALANREEQAAMEQRQLKAKQEQQESLACLKQKMQEEFERKMKGELQEAMKSMQAENAAKEQAHRSRGQEEFKEALATMKSMQAESSAKEQAHRSREQEDLKEALAGALKMQTEASEMSQAHRYREQEDMEAEQKMKEQSDELREALAGVKKMKEEMAAMASRDQEHAEQVELEKAEQAVRQRQAEQIELGKASDDESDDGDETMASQNSKRPRIE